MLYFDFPIPSHRDQQARFKEEFEKNNQCEWTEQRPGQPLGVFHAQCHYSYGIVKVICPQCGEAFYCKSESYHNGRKYCSARCINDAYIARRVVWRENARDKICPTCGKRFHAKRKDTIYCSLACKQRQYRLKKS